MLEIRQTFKWLEKLLYIAEMKGRAAADPAFTV
jgi:hypothetical protein